MRKVLFCLSLTFLFVSVKAQSEKIIENFTIQGNQLPTEKTFVINESGILIVEFDEASINNNIQAEITPYLSKNITVNEARIDFTGNVKIIIKQRYNRVYNETINATIKLLPIIDAFEPNDTFDQSANIGLFTWYQNMMFPKGDVDFFKFRTEKPYWIYPEFQESTLRLKTELYNSQNEYLTNTFPYYAKAGEYTYKIAPSYSQSSKDSIFFKLVILPEYDELEPNNESHVLIENKKRYRVNFSAKTDVDLLLLKANENGYAIFETANILRERVRFQYKKNYGNPLVVPTKKGDSIKVKMLPTRDWTNVPFLLYSEIQNVLDVNEPNDSIPIATRLNRNEGLYFSIFPSTDEDWFEVITTGESKITVNVFDELFKTGNVNPKDIIFELYDSEKTFKYPLKYRFSSFGAIYSTEVIKDAGNWYLRAISSKQLQTERLLGIKIFGSNIEGEANKSDFDDIYFVGFELDSSANLSIKSLVETTSAPYVMVDSTGSLGKTMSKVFKEAKREGNSKIWVVILILVIIIAVYYWFIYTKRANK